MALRLTGKFFLFLSFWLILSSPALSFDVKRFFNEADTYLKQGMYLEALGTYRDIIGRSNDPEVLAQAVFRTGYIYAYFLKDYKRALAEFDTLIKRHPKSGYVADAIFNSGLLLYEMGHNREAREQFQIYLARYPQGARRDVAAFMIDATKQKGKTDRQEALIETALDEVIRVLLASDLRQLRVSSRESFIVKDKETQKTLLNLSSVFMEPQGEQISVEGRIYNSRQIEIAPAPGGMLEVNGRPFRGNLVITRAASGLEVINIVNLEAYLYGVVPQEMSFRWPLEALKAQAVAARTYAFYLMDRNRHRDYDVCATVMTQVYGGAAGETENTSRAVDETKGKMLYFNGQPALIYYHAHSGGITESSGNVWSVDVPYLRSIVDIYSDKAPDSAWSVTLNYDAIRQSLVKGGFDIGPIESLTASEISPSGRVVKIRIAHRGGELIVSGNDFRLKIDPKVIRSTLFSLSSDRSTVRLEGRGYGHGVGMSQWGAFVMAREGYSYQEILKHYYPGLEIR